ncbi:MAG: Ig-like domain-containing protein [Bacteroidales bacterium]|nr:Ig-like domain-containing protein [Bacteroidales bacterium]
MIFLSKLTRSKESKRFILLLCFVSLTLFTVAQTGVINNGAKMIINSGAVMKITGSGADYTNASYGGKDGRIDLDGKIELHGDWINPNDTVLINVDSDGIVLFNGTASQSISGSASLFENFTIDNATGLSLSADAEVGNVLSLSNGLVTLNSNNLIIGSSGTISGGTFGPTRMIVTNGSGTLRKSVVGAGSFIFPIGDNTSGAEYSPVDFDLTAYSDIVSAWVSARVTDAKHSSNTSPSEFLSRYWTLSSSGITAPNYDADFKYLQADVVGTEANIYAAEYDGSVRTVYSTVDVTNNILPVTGLSSFADYTGVDGTVPTVLISTSESDTTNTNPIPFTVTFSEAVTEFVVGDIGIINGSVSNFNDASNPVFTFDVTPAKDSTVTIDVGAGVAQDAAGNDNTAATTYRIEYDGTDPVVSTLYPGVGQANIGLADNLQMTFDEFVYLNTGNIEIRKVTGGTLVESINVTSLDGDGTETITINPSSDFESQVEYYVLVPSGAFIDAAGNEYAGISGTTDWTFTTVDINNPYISFVSPEDESPEVSVTSDLVITFSENVNAVAGKYITIMNASTSSTHETIEASNGIVTINNEVVTINPSIDFAGETDYYVLIDEGAFEDTESNPFAGISSVVYWNFTTEDISVPTVTITSTESDPTNVSPFEVSIEFSEVVTGFEIGDITVGNGAAGNLNTSDNITFIADITPTADGLVTVDVAADVATDAADNGNTAATQFSITYDGTVPTVTITSTEPDPTFNSNFDITIEFSEEVTGFELTDIIVGNGTAGNFSTTDNTIFTSTITPDVVGSVTVDVFAGVASDPAGNVNTAATQFSIQFDGIKPDVTVSTTASDPTNVSPITFDIVFEIEVTGFELTDITVTNASASNLQTSDSISFTVDITPDSDGLVSVLVPAGVAETSIGNVNNASNTANITYDTTSPSVTITSVESGTVTGNFDITITFSEVVTGFTSDDITVVNGSVNSFTASTADQIWTVTIAPVTDGDVTVNISAGLAQDAAGNDNTAADQFSITYDSGVGFEDLIPYEISIYSLENRVIVEFTNEGNYQFEKGIIEVYNLLGQKITSSNINDFVKFETKVEHVSQIYIVKVVIDGVPYTKRLYIE